MDIDPGPPQAAQGSGGVSYLDLDHNYDYAKDDENILDAASSPDDDHVNMDIDVDNPEPPTSSNPGAGYLEPSIRRDHLRTGRQVTTSIAQPPPSNGGRVLKVPTEVEFVDETGRVTVMDSRHAEATRSDVLQNMCALEKGRDIALAVLQIKVRG